MSSDLIEKQLKKVQNADLSNFDSTTNTYFIKKRVDIKIEEEKCYLIYLKDSLFENTVLKTNWNGGSVPPCTYIKAEVSKIMGKMIKIVGVGTNDIEKLNNNIDVHFWTGWLSTQDIKIIQKL